MSCRQWGSLLGIRLPNPTQTQLQQPLLHHGFRSTQKSPWNSGLHIIDSFDDGHIRSSWPWLGNANGTSMEGSQPRRQASSLFLDEAIQLSKHWNWSWRNCCLVFRWQASSGTGFVNRRGDCSWWWLDCLSTFWRRFCGGHEALVCCTALNWIRSWSLGMDISWWFNLFVSALYIIIGHEWHDSPLSQVVDSPYRMCVPSWGITCWQALDPFHHSLRESFGVLYSGSIQLNQVYKDSWKATARVSSSGSSTRNAYNCVLSLSEWKARPLRSCNEDESLPETAQTSTVFFKVRSTISRYNHSFRSAWSVQESAMHSTDSQIFFGRRPGWLAGCGLLFSVLNDAFIELLFFSQ